MNEIKIDGRICNQNKTTFSSGKCVTRFGLHIYNGKKDGNKVYDFIDCKYFGELNISDKTDVDVEGWIGVESWQKDGKEYKKVIVYARKVKPQGQKEQTQNQIIDDDMPFN